MNAVGLLRVSLSTGNILNRIINLLLRSKINWCPPLSAGLVLMDEWDVLYIESARIPTFPGLNQASLIWTFSPLKSIAAAMS